MALKFFFDTHIAKSAALQLRAKGVDVVRCEEVDMADALDEDLLQYATDENRIMVSQDDDFTKLHVKWQESNKKHAGIIKLPRSVQKEAQISLVVNDIAFYDEAEQGGAIDYYTEIENTIIYL